MAPIPRDPPRRARRRRRLLLCIVAPALVLASCGTTIQPYYDRFRVEMEFETSRRDGDFRQAHERTGVALSRRLIDEVEWFVDVAAAAVEDREDSRLDADGYALGAGIGSARPREPGWSVDWAARLGYHNLDFGSRARPADPDWEYSGSEVDLHVGAMRAFALGGDTLLGVQAGVFGKEMSEHLTDGLTSSLGTFWWILSGGRLDPEGEDPDYEFSSAGVYAGVDLFSPDSGSFDCTAGAYYGTSRLHGFFVGAGFCF